MFSELDKEFRKDDAARMRLKELLHDPVLERAIHVLILQYGAFAAPMISGVTPEQLRDRASWLSGFNRFPAALAALSEPPPIPVPVREPFAHVDVPEQYHDYPSQ